MDIRWRRVASGALAALALLHATASAAETFRRDAGAWKMVASHVAVVTQDPPGQPVSKEGWAALAGTYQLLPDGWTFTVALRDGVLYGGRDPDALRPFIPLAPDAFVL